MKKINLTKGQFSIVDDEDYIDLNKYKWFAVRGTKNNSFYAARSYMGKHQYLHRYLMVVNNRLLQVDHIDKNGLNNQRCNLRVCTHSENMKNRAKKKNSGSKYLGVYFQKATKDNKRITDKYIVRIQYNGKNRYIGTFKTEIDAAKAYNKVAAEAHGQFANLNQI
jgi:hypothetical protein